MLTIFLNLLDTAEEKDKLTAIYEKYYGIMLSVAKSIIADHAMAEDAVSDSILTIIKNLHKINGVSSHKTRAYIVIIVRSRSINLLKKQKNHPEEPIDEFDFSDNDTSAFNILTTNESYDLIIKHIKALPKTLSDVLYLWAVLDHKIEEIANLLNISNDAVRQRLHRAKVQVKITLAQEGIDHAEKRY